jgi:hypothetical protein
VDNPNNPMVITVLMTFDTPLDYERLKATLEVLLRFKRFHQRLIKPNFPFLRPYWEDDPNFHFDAHLFKVELPLPADQKALQDLVSSSMSTGLEPSRPLWKFYFVENYGKGSALIARIHHSLADGISLMQVLLSMTDPDNKPGASDLAHRLAQDKLRSPNGKGKASRSKVLDSSNRRAKFLWNEGKQIIFDPSHARHRARQITVITATVGRLVIRWPRSQTNLKGSLGKKRAAWSEPIVLEEVKLVGKNFIAPLMTYCYLLWLEPWDNILFLEQAPLGHRYQQFLPVNLRLNMMRSWKQFGVVLISLPVGSLIRSKDCTGLSKIWISEIIFRTVTSFGIINIIRAVPSVQDIAVDFIDAKVQR